MLEFRHPFLLALIPLAVCLVCWLEWRLPARTSRRIVRSLARGVVLSLGIAALANPVIVRRTSSPARVVVALDESLLNGERGRRELVPWIGSLKAQAKAKHVALHYVPFGDQARPMRLAPPSLNLPRENAPSAPDFRHTSQVAAALGIAPLAFQDGDTGGVIVLTNGHGNHRDLHASLKRCAARGLHVAAIALPLTNPPAKKPSVDVVAFPVPKQAMGPIALRAAIRGVSRARAEVSIDGVPYVSRELANQKTLDVEVDFGRIEMSPGMHTISLRVVRPLEGSNTESTVLAESDRRIEVRTKPSTLLLHSDIERSPFVRAWRAEGTRFELMQPAQVVQLEARLAAKHATPPGLLLADATSLAMLTPKQTRALQGAIRRGLGLVVEAGEHRDAWEQLVRSPLRAILPLMPKHEPKPPPAPTPLPPPAEPKRPIEQPKPDDGPGFRAERQPEEAIPITVLLLVDQSGSMEGEKFAMALEGARRTAAALSSWDRLGVITFASEPRVVLKPRRVRESTQRSLWAAGLRADGTATDIFAALKKAAALLDRPANQTPIQHIILLTDGAQNVGAPIFSPIVRPLGARGVTITAVGIGRGARLRDLREIVHWAAGGSVIAARTAGEIPTILTRDTTTLAERRSVDAKALARMRNPQETRPPPKPKPEKQDAPSPLPSKDPLPPLDPEPDGPAVTERKPLRIVQRHEALLGVRDGHLPAVTPVYANQPAQDAIVLMARDEDAALAARREGLGRVLVWAVPSDDPGTERWEDWGLFLQQARAAAVAPAGSFDRVPHLQIRQSPEASSVDISWPPGMSVGEVSLQWIGPGEVTQPLGVVRASREPTSLPLPDATAGALCRVSSRMKDGTHGLSIDYRRRAYPSEGEPRGDADRLASVMGQAPASAKAFFSRLEEGRIPIRQSLWPLLVAAIIVLLPFDVALHRRSVS